jgi:predicted DCC family thiol-disulfide oxidoreductase YuxK
MNAEKDIVFYDGHCALCLGSIQFILKRDKQGVFQFAPLQGPAAKRLHIGPNLPDSIVVMAGGETGVLLVRSLAVLRILRQLGPGWRFLAFLARILPQKLSDSIYDAIAVRRKDFFGGHQTCQLPPANWAERVIQA